MVDTTHAFRYDPVANTVAALASLPRPVSQAVAITVVGRLWLLGGGATPANQVDVYDPATNAWSAGPAFANPRRLHAAAIDPLTEWVFLAGGYETTAPAGNMEMFEPGIPCGK